MSRVGKKPINIPSGVEITIDGQNIKAKGPKGELSLEINPAVSIEKNENVLILTIADEENKAQKAIWGTNRNLVSNIIEGVSKGFEKKLEVNGVGYKVAISGSKLTLNVGYSHPVDFNLPEGVSGQVEKNLITLTSIDKQLLGEVAAQIRKVRKPESYKGKGIKYADEQIRRKAGKAAKAGA